MEAQLSIYVAFYLSHLLFFLITSAICPSWLWRCCVWSPRGGCRRGAARRAPAAVTWLIVPSPPRRGYLRSRSGVVVLPRPADHLSPSQCAA